MQAIYKHAVYFAIALLLYQVSFSQCTIQKGPAPGSFEFETGGVPAGSPDKKWTTSESLDGEYEPAIILDSLPSVFYHSNNWISLTEDAEHSGDQLFYFKTKVDLPCKNLCDISYNEPNTFCLSFSIYSDNSVYEIYVNGKPQSDHLDNVPVANPYHPDDAFGPAIPVNVRLCQDWKAGTNELIIAVASSAPIVALLVMETREPPLPSASDTAKVEICQGTTYTFNGQQLNSSGIYWYSYTNSSGCDSLKVLDLKVNPVPGTVINTEICKGQSFEGYSESGNYRDVFTTSSGCDSIRVLNLVVNSTPDPELGLKKAICRNDSMVLSPGKFVNYKWQDGSTNDHFVVRQPGLYSVEVSNGCYTSREEIVIADGLCEVLFPNAFSPNGDGKNEQFMPSTDLLLQSYRLAVYNRWGQKIFESTDRMRGWDGMLSGRLQSPGTYAWVCTFQRLGMNIQKKGTVILTE